MGGTYLGFEFSNGRWEFASNGSILLAIEAKVELFDSGADDGGARRYRCWLVGDGGVVACF